MTDVLHIHKCKYINVTNFETNYTRQERTISRLKLMVILLYNIVVNNKYIFQ